MQGASQPITEMSRQESGEVQYRQFAIPVPGSSQWVNVSLGYRRATEFDRANQPGQDYAVVRGGDGFVVGVVADGVSQSFYGHLAARVVAVRLLELLWARREASPSAEHLNGELRTFESEFKANWIDNYTLPEHLQPLLRDALEQKRAQAGSQAVFAAFVLDAAARKVRLFAVGDAPAVVHCARPETNGSHSKVIQADHRGRWSSLGRAELLLEEVHEQNVRGIVIKSDGAKDWGASLAPSKFDQVAFSEAAPGLADYDDVSFVAAVFQDEPVAALVAVPEVERALKPPAPPAPSPRPDPRPPQPPRPIAPPPPVGVLISEPSYVIAPASSAKSRKGWAMFALGVIITLVGALVVEFILRRPPAPDCKVTLNDQQLTVKAAPTTGAVQVKAAATCKWSVASMPAWIKLNSPREGSGNGWLEFSIAQNTGPEREEALEINGNKFWVKQTGCVYQLEPKSEEVSARGGRGQFKIKADADCIWTPSTAEGWIELESGDERSGSGEVVYNIAPNTDQVREGLIKLGPTSFKITQLTAEQKTAPQVTAREPAPPIIQQKVASKGAQQTPAPKNSKQRTAQKGDGQKAAPKNDERKAAQKNDEQKAEPKSDEQKAAPKNDEQKAAPKNGEPKPTPKPRTPNAANDKRATTLPRNN